MTEVSQTGILNVWVDYCFGALSLTPFLTHTHAHSHWLSQGSGLQKGYWGCGSSGCVMQCSGSHVFPGNSQGFFSQSMRAHGGREQLTRNIHTYLSSSLFWKCDYARPRWFFFLWLCVVKGNLCHEQISIICRSNLFLAKLHHNPSNEKLFPLMSDNRRIIPVAPLSSCLYVG